MPKNQAAPITQDAAIQEMNRLLFEAPIAELAESQGISIDEAVKLRVEKSIEAAPLPIEVTVRPIEPMGSLRGYASVNIGGIVVDDFKVVDGKNGMFLSPPQQGVQPDAQRLPGYHTGDEPGAAGAAGRPDRGRLQRGGGAACGPCRGPAPRPHPGADGAGRAGGGQGQRQPSRPGEGQGGQG